MTQDEIERLRQEVRDTDKMARNTIEQYRAENEELKNALKQSEDNYSKAFERLKAQGREIAKLKEENTTLYEVRNNLLEENDQLLKDNVALILGKKQAEIDVLNKLKERAIGYTFLGEKLATETDIDELIEEIENEQCF